MPRINNLIAATVLLIFAIVLISLPEHASSRASLPKDALSRAAEFAQEPQDNSMPGMDHSTSSSTDVPAFHSTAPTGPLPETMDPAQFPDRETSNAYAAAARIRKTLYQQPCYCHCDHTQGHTSLLDCFVSRHGSGCNICKSEALFAFEQLRKGKTPAQIREAIIHGDWQNFDLAKYRSAPLPPAK